MDFSSIDSALKEIAEHVILFGGAFMALLYGIKRIYTTAKNVEKILENSNVNSTTIANLQAAVSTITREITPNGGSSMKDQLTKVSNDIGNIKERLATVEQWKKDIED